MPRGGLGLTAAVSRLDVPVLRDDRPLDSWQTVGEWERENMQLYRNSAPVFIQEGSAHGSYWALTSWAKARGLGVPALVADWRGVPPEDFIL